MDKKSIRQLSAKLFNNQGFSIFIILFVAALLFVPRFGNSLNLMNVMRQGALIFCFSIGMTMVMILGGLDLSIGAVAALSSVLAATFIKNNQIVLGVLIGLGTGLAIGVISGTVIARFKLPHFIMTYGMMQIANGLTLNYTKGESIYGLPDSFRFLGIGFLGAIPVPVICGIALLIIFAFAMNRTILGRSIYAVGDSQTAAAFSAISVKQTIIATYALSGLLSSITGIIYTARLGSAEGVMGQDWAMQAIAAAVLGGTSFAGGEGSVSGTAFGAIAVAILYNILNLVGFSPSWQKFAIGFVIVMTVTCNYLQKGLAARRLKITGRAGKEVEKECAAEQ